mmetsp:Transcript_40924/g.127715  ORF Transcript_40924/g.127715 Transcript_40924/m.127715 type:complete len:210 (+) Transcript_40924:53-682(+)
MSSGEGRCWRLPACVPPSTSCGRWPPPLRRCCCRALPGRRSMRRTAWRSWPSMRGRLCQGRCMGLRPLWGLRSSWDPRRCRCERSWHNRTSGGAAGLQRTTPSSWPLCVCAPRTWRTSPGSSPSASSSTGMSRTALGAAAMGHTARCAPRMPPGCSTSWRPAALDARCCRRCCRALRPGSTALAPHGASQRCGPASRRHTSRRTCSMGS